MFNYLAPIFLLLGSNIFMTLAWYGHLKFTDRPLWIVVLVSWGIAFFEYCLQVPGNRIGYQVYNPAQLKTIQEIIHTLLVFVAFSTLYLGATIRWNHSGGLCPDCGRGVFHFSRLADQQSCEQCMGDTEDSRDYQQHHRDTAEQKTNMPSRRRAHVATEIEQTSKHSTARKLQPSTTGSSSVPRSIAPGMNAINNSSVFCLHAEISARTTSLPLVTSSTPSTASSTLARAPDRPGKPEIHSAQCSSKVDQCHAAIVCYQRPEAPNRVKISNGPHCSQINSYRSRIHEFLYFHANWTWLKKSRMAYSDHP